MCMCVCTGVTACMVPTDCHACKRALALPPRPPLHSAGVQHGSHCVSWGHAPSATVSWSYTARVRSGLDEGRCARALTSLPSRTGGTCSSSLFNAPMMELHRCSWCLGSHYRGRLTTLWQLLPLCRRSLWTRPSVTSRFLLTFASAAASARRGYIAAATTQMWRSLVIPRRRDLVSSHATGCGPLLVHFR